MRLTDAEKECLHKVVIEQRANYVLKGFPKRGTPEYIMYPTPHMITDPSQKQVSGLYYGLFTNPGRPTKIRSDTILIGLLRYLSQRS